MGRRRSALYGPWPRLTAQDAPITRAEPRGHSVAGSSLSARSSPDAWKTGNMRSRTNRIVEGEAFGAPVPGGWPSKGPIEALRGLIWRRRRRTDGDALSDPQNGAGGLPVEET